MPRLTSQPDKKFSRILLTYPILPELSLEQFMKTRQLRQSTAHIKVKEKGVGKKIDSLW